MSLHDVLFNWLQLRLVVDQRPDDEAAIDSLNHINDILKQVHQASVLSAAKADDRYQVTYQVSGKEESQFFSSSEAEILLQFINENPERYNFN